MPPRINSPLFYYLVAASILFSVEVQAYVGPGAGLSLIGSVIGLLSTIFFALFMIILLPIRKARKQKRINAENQRDIDKGQTNKNIKATSTDTRKNTEQKVEKEAQVETSSGAVKGTDNSPESSENNVSLSS